MAGINLAIIYYSSTGANFQLATWAAEAAKQTGTEIRLLRFKETAPKEAIQANAAWQKHSEATAHIPEVSLSDLEWADAIIFSTPTRYGNAPSQVRTFLDTTGSLWFKGRLANKVVSAMSTAMNPHGGQEATILSLYTTMYHWGAIIAAPGYTDQSSYAAGGNPYGTSATVTQDGTIKEDVKRAVQHQAKRTVAIASMIKKGLQEK